MTSDVLVAEAEGHHLDSTMTEQHGWFFSVCIFGDLTARNTYMKCCEFLGVAGISCLFWCFNIFLITSF